MNTVAQLVKLVRDGDMDGARQAAAGIECPGKSLGSPDDVYSIMRETTLAEQEEVWLLYATHRNTLKRKELVFVGGASASIVDVAVVLRKVLLSGALAFVMVHNHPSGTADPSPEDTAITRHIELGATAIGVTLLDHVIIAVSGWYSFKDHNLI